MVDNNNSKENAKALAAIDEAIKQFGPDHPEVLSRLQAYHELLKGKPEENEGFRTASSRDKGATDAKLSSKTNVPKFCIMCGEGMSGCKRCSCGWSSAEQPKPIFQIAFCALIVLCLGVGWYVYNT